MRDFTHIAGSAVAILLPIVLVGALGETQREGSSTRATPEYRGESPLVSSLIGSKHDFSQPEPHPRDLCLPCHAPHLPELEPPLLDRQPAATQPIRAYASLPVDLNGASLLCLSCHDGVVASDVFTSSHSTRLASQVGASHLGYGGLGGHPVGIKYPVGDPKYHLPAAVTADGRIKLPDGRVQCTSCHDPHNHGRHAGMLVKSDERSRLCLSCHRL